MRTTTLALVGNPNSGKTTLFNALTGSAQYVGNWPGVTVDKMEGRLKADASVIVADLPGIYSMSPYSPEEIVTRNYLTEQKPSGVINLVDGTNIERNLYLTTQCLETGVPVVVALNMMDVVRRSGDTVDTQKLAEELGCEVVEISALKNEGLEELSRKAIAMGTQNRAKLCVLGEQTERALSLISNAISGCTPSELLRWYSIKLFERDNGVRERLGLPHETHEYIENIIRSVENEMDDDAESIIANERYNYVTALVRRCVVKAGGVSVTDRIDRVLTHRVFAIPIFAAIMLGVYYLAISSVGGYSVELMESFFGWLSELAGGFLQNTPAWVGSLVTDGIIGGVGSVLGFVPQLLILFILLAVLEDVGYMARVAFIMDRAFRRFGLSGKSVIPLIVSSGCGVPGIMATRAIENEKDRRMTAIVTTFIPCGAKLPVIALITGGMLGGAWWVAPLMYLAGIAAVVVSGLILKLTRPFAGKPAPFVMELPQYHQPDARSVFRQVYDRGKSFVTRAGTVILFACVILWFLQNFGFTDGRFGMVSENSLLETVGGMLAPLFAPLGFGRWETVVATLTGFVAKEQIVGTLSVLSAEFTSAAAGMSFLIFNLLCAPCVAAIGAVRRELGGRWAAFAVAYQTAFAYVVALAVYQISRLF